MCLADKALKGTIKLKIVRVLPYHLHRSNEDVKICQFQNTQHAANTGVCQVA